MAMTVVWLEPDRVVEFIASGELSTDDLLALSHLNLDERTEPLWALYDATRLELSLPDNTLGLAGKMGLDHPMLKHLAVFGAPAVIQIFGRLVTKVGRMRDKVSFHATREQALAKLKEYM